LFVAEDHEASLVLDLAVAVRLDLKHPLGTHGLPAAWASDVLVGFVLFEGCELFIDGARPVLAPRARHSLLVEAWYTILVVVGSLKRFALAIFLVEVTWWLPLVVLSARFLVRRVDERV